MLFTGKIVYFAGVLT